MVNNILSIAGLLLILIPAVFYKESLFRFKCALALFRAAILIYSNKGNDTMLHIYCSKKQYYRPNWYYFIFYVPMALANICFS
jgi:hypothetical protein